MLVYSWFMFNAASPATVSPATGASAPVASRLNLDLLTLRLLRASA
jgi:hypothetical protein